MHCPTSFYTNKTILLWALAVGTVYVATCWRVLDTRDLPWFLVLSVAHARYPHPMLQRSIHTHRAHAFNTHTHTGGRASLFEPVTWAPVHILTMTTLTLAPNFNADLLQCRARYADNTGYSALVAPTAPTEKRRWRCGGNGGCNGGGSIGGGGGKVKLSK